MRRILGMMWSVPAFFAVISAPLYAQMPPQKPDAKAIKFGSLDLVVLHDAQYVKPNDGTTYGLGHTPAEVTKILAAAGAPTENISLSVDALLIKSTNRVVLIDTGIGGALQQSMKQSGIDPSSVTDILITHSHPDHIGGLANGGKLAFPGATIHMSNDEWKFAQGNDQVRAIVDVIDGHVETFRPGEEVVPQIKSVPLPGHTPGHVGYEITSGNQKLLDIGDTAHSSIISLAEPEWQIAFDTDKNAAEANRITTLKALASTDQLVYSPHFPFPGIGYIRAVGDHFRWDPSLPNAN